MTIIINILKIIWDLNYNNMLKITCETWVWIFLLLKVAINVLKNECDIIFNETINLEHIIAI